MKHNYVADNRKIIIGLIIFEIIVLVICFLVYKLSENSSIDNIEPVKQVRSAEEPIISLSSYPKVDASTNMQNLATAFINDFTGSNLSNSELDYSNGQSAYYRLADGTVDIVIAKEPSEDEIEYAERKGVTIEYVPRYDTVEEIVSDYWIDALIRMAVALTKITVGRVRTRYTQANALWTQDGTQLLQEGLEEYRALQEYLQANTQLVYGID